MSCHLGDGWADAEDFVGSALLISAALLAALDGYAPVMAGFAPLSSWLLGGLGAVLLFVTWPSDDV